MSLPIKYINQRELKMEYNEIKTAVLFGEWNYSGFFFYPLHIFFWFSFHNEDILLLLFEEK